MPSPWRRVQPILHLVLAIVLGAAACKRNGTPVPSGDITASLGYPSLGATAFDPQSLKGKPSLVMFVTPTCPHCLATIPRAAAAAQAKGANVVAVFVAGQKQNVEGVVSHAKFTGVALVPEKDGQKALIDKFQIKGVPYALVLGPDGKAREAFRGEQDESTFADALDSAR
jgi:thiol-disulfide isomerase/thioredoxin